MTVRWTIALTALVLAGCAEAYAYDWSQISDWLPDAAVGLAFVAAGLAGGVRLLLLATGATWFLGNFNADLSYVHRGVLVHLLLTYPGVRPASAGAWLVTLGGYGAALATPVWRDDPASIVLAVGLAVTVGVQYGRSRGRARGPRRTAFAAGVLVAAVLATGAIARLTSTSADVVLVTLYTYEAALVVMAALLGAGLTAAPAAAIADLVVELGDRASGSLRDRLARAIGDPTLVLGYWSAGDDAYVDAAGAPLAALAPDRAQTPVDRDSRPFAVLVHDREVLGDPALVGAVAAATRLSASNVALRSEVQEQATQLAAARRRLLLVADAERERLEARLHDGPARRLAAVEEQLAALPAGDEHLVRARDHLRRTLAELSELATGLHPRELTDLGLSGALEAVVARSVVPVTIDAPCAGLPKPVEAALYFVCVESLANVAKHAPTALVTVRVRVGADVVLATISDNGPGGADARGGSGLQGLADRVAALGGTLAVVSPPGGGTRVDAAIPLT